jgi:hypothetical protein
MIRASGLLALTAIVLSFVCGIASAEVATEAEATNVARNWMTYIVNERGFWGGVTNPSIAQSREIVVSDTLLGWYFEASPKGFVIVPALKELPPVKLYSGAGRLDMEATGGLAQLTKDVLQNRIRIFADRFGTLEAVQPKTGDFIFDPVNREQWSKFAKEPNEFVDDYTLAKFEPLTQVGPLLTTSWNQSSPYNDLCPRGYGGDRCVVGCVATAASQVLNYHMYPDSGFGSHCYDWDGDDSCEGSTSGDRLCADFSDPYAWSDIPDSCDMGCTPEQEAAVAELCHEVGVAYEMNYGVCASYAYTTRAVSIFPAFWGYSCLADVQNRGVHTPSSWFAIIQEEINAARPILYNFSTANWAHAIVCDGWRDTGGQNQYHMNYGWGGYSTAWYVLDNMPGSLVDLETMVRRIMPAEQPPQIVSDSLAQSETAGNGNGYLDPGESIDLSVRLLNTGPEVTNVSATISTSDPNVDITSGSASYGSIPCGGTCESSPSYSFSLDSLSTTDAVIFQADVTGDSYTDSTEIFVGVSDSIGFLEWQHAAITEGFWDQWHISTVRNHTPGGIVSWKCGDPEGGKYTGRMDAGFVSEPFFLDEDDVVGLTFWHWMETYSRGDGGILEVSEDGGPWEQIYPSGGYPASYQGNSQTALPDGTPCFSGTDGWEAVVADLISYSGMVRVRFRFATDVFSAREGWYIDDVALAPIEFANGAFGVLADEGKGCGVSWGDYDGDGDEDLYVSNNSTANRLLRNNGGGDFTDVSDPMTTGDVGYGHCATWGDYDNDGDPDLYLVNGGPNRLFRNDDTTFVDVTSGDLGHAGWAWCGQWVDYDNDSELDLYIVNYNGANKLLRNDGGVFSDASSGVVADAGWGHAAAWGDYDNDGDQDLYIGNEGANKLIRNDGGGAFTDVTTSVTGDEGWARGVSWADYDNDGDLDLYIANYGSSNKLLRNDGGVFADVTISPLDDAGYGQGVAWGDYDKDGYLDLYLVNYTGENKLFKNETGSFTDVTSIATGHPGSDRGSAWADYDNDGDLDIYVANYDGSNLLFKYVAPNENHWLHVRLVGTESNLSGIGGRVRVVTGSGSQIREVSGGDGYCSQSSLTCEFGLGSYGVVDTVVVTWPSGIVQKLTAVDVDTLLVVVEEDLSPAGDIARSGFTFGAHANYPNPFNPFTVISFELPTKSEVSVIVYDVSGRVVRRLLTNELMGVGMHKISWDGTNERGDDVSSGVYFYKLEANGLSETNSMVLVK